MFLVYFKNNLNHDIDMKANIISGRTIDRNLAKSPDELHRFSPMSINREELRSPMEREKLSPMGFNTRNNNVRIF